MMTCRSILAAFVVAAALLGAAAVPAGAETPWSPDHLWVDATYRTLLQRGPSPRQLQNRLAQLAAGKGRRFVATELVRSAERRDIVIERTFRQVLGRFAGPSDVAYWRNRMDIGTWRRMTASLYGSAEYYDKAGGTDEAFVAALYRDLLGRTGDPVKLAAWVRDLQRLPSRTELAVRWLSTTVEVSELRANLLFLDLLGRPLTGVTDQRYWGGRYRQADEPFLEVALVTTAEFTRRAEQRATGFNALTVRADTTVGEPALSRDGRYIVFASAATNLVPTPTTPGADVFVADMTSGALRAATTGGGVVGPLDVSADGTTVVFATSAALVPDDDEGHVDVYRLRIPGFGVERLTAGDGDSVEPTVSADGSVVAFQSVATDLVAGDANGASDVFVRTDGSPATVVRIGGNGASTQPDLAADGSAVAFTSDASDLVPDDVNAATDTFWAATAPNGPIVQVNQAPGAATPPSISDDGGEVGYRDGAGPTLAALVDGAVTTRVVIGGGLEFDVELAGSGPPTGQAYLLRGIGGIGQGGQPVYVERLYSAPGGELVATIGSPAGLSGDGLRAASVSITGQVTVFDRL